MEIPPNIKKLLDKLGVNTTRLQWRLYERERKKAAGETGPRLPSWLRWMKYTHKFCPECGGLVDRADRLCAGCGAAVPSMAVYRATRTLGLVMPQGGIIVVAAFLTVIVAVYGLSILIGGTTAIMAPQAVDGLLNQFGAQSNVRIRFYDEYWRLFSSGLMHIGLIHIGFNTMALLQIAPFIEREIGPRRMLVLITVTQLASAGASYYRDIAGAGASGWLFGLIGFGVAYFHRHGRSGLDTRNFFVQWAIYGVIFSFLFPFINRTAHFGGMIAGAVLGLTADVTLARKTVWTAIWDFLFWPCLVLWLATLFFLARSILSG